MQEYIVGNTMPPTTAMHSVVNDTSLPSPRPYPTTANTKSDTTKYQRIIVTDDTGPIANASLPE